jgi:hypothetical protein
MCMNCTNNERTMHYKASESVVINILYACGLSLPRRTTNDLAGGGAFEGSPELDPLAIGWESFRSRRTTNERPALVGLFVNAAAAGRASSPSLCRRGLRNWNQCRFLVGRFTSEASSSEMGLTTSESCECLRNDDGAGAASWDDGNTAAFGGAGACSITALCDFLRTCGGKAPEGRLEWGCRSAFVKDGVTDGLDSCETLCGVGGWSRDGNVCAEPVATEYGVSKCDRPPPIREKPVFAGDSGGVA